MAWWTTRISRFGQTRRGLRALDRIATALETQAALLTRMAEVVAPLPPDAPSLQDTGVSFCNEAELARIAGFIERTVHVTGRVPSDDEVLQWLASEAQAEALHTEERG